MSSLLNFLHNFICFHHERLSGGLACTRGGGQVPSSSEYIRREFYSVQRLTACTCAFNMPPNLLIYDETLFSFRTLASAHARISPFNFGDTDEKVPQHTQHFMLSARCTNIFSYLLNMFRHIPVWCVTTADTMNPRGYTVSQAYTRQARPFDYRQIHVKQITQHFIFFLLALSHAFHARAPELSSSRSNNP